MFSELYFPLLKFSLGLPPFSFAKDRRYHSLSEEFSSITNTLSLGDYPIHLLLSRTDILAEIINDAACKTCTCTMIYSLVIHRRKPSIDILFSLSNYSSIAARGSDSTQGTIYIWTPIK